MAPPIGVRHQTMQQLRRLSRRRSARDEAGAYVVDGPTLLADALDAGVELVEVVAEAGAPDDLLARAAASGARVRTAADGALARVVDAVTPQGVAAIARLGPDRGALADAVAHAGPLVLVLVGVGDPGNVGTLLRSAEAAGAGAVLCADGTADPFGPKCVRSSAGSVFRLSVVRAVGASEAVDALRAAGIATVATTVTGDRPYDDVDLTGPVALMLGSEAHGLPAALASAADLAVTIPMSGRTESLNVGMAGTVLCFEALRQRRAAGARAAGATNRLDATPPRAAGCTTT